MSELVDNVYVCVACNVWKQAGKPNANAISSAASGGEHPERILTQTNWLSSAVTWWYFGILDPHWTLPCTLSAPGSCGLWPFTPFFIAEIEFDRLHCFHHRTCQHIRFYPRLRRKLKQNINMANILRGTLKHVSKSRGGRRLFWSKNPELNVKSLQRHL